LTNAAQYLVTPMLNPEAPAPLYRQLAEELERAIETGTLKPGDRIASEHALAAAHGIGRPTVRQATDYLVRQGLLERRRGAGTFVLAPRRRVDLFTLTGTVAAFEGAGIDLTMRISSPVKLRVPQDVSSESAPRGSCYSYVRIGSVGDRAVLLEALELDAFVFRHFDQLPIEHETLSSLVQKRYQRRPCAGRQTIRAWSLTHDEAELLGAEAGHRALLIERTLDFAGAPAAIFARMVVLTERVVLTQSLSQSDALAISTNSIQESA
jgi:GntR family transcriptional regulator